MKLDLSFRLSHSLAAKSTQIRNHSEEEFSMDKLSFIWRSERSLWFLPLSFRLKCNLVIKGELMYYFRSGTSERPQPKRNSIILREWFFREFLSKPRLCHGKAKFTATMYCPCFMSFSWFDCMRFRTKNSKQRGSNDCSACKFNI
jgi:hypothetical protein